MPLVPYWWAQKTQKDTFVCLLYVTYELPLSSATTNNRTNSSNNDLRVKKRYRQFIVFVLCNSTFLCAAVVSFAFTTNMNYAGSYAALPALANVQANAFDVQAPAC